MSCSAIGIARIKQPWGYAPKSWRPGQYIALQSVPIDLARNGSEEWRDCRFYQVIATGQMELEPCG